MGKRVDGVKRSSNLRAIAPLLREAQIEITGAVSWAELEEMLRKSNLPTSKRMMIRDELWRARLLK
jgi:hypothetical protein